VPDPEIRWQMVQEPTCDDWLVTLRPGGAHAWLTIERASAELEPSPDRQGV
jgi:hypothetical protein